MREILQQLNAQADLSGSMIMTPDGIMVAADLGPEYDEDAIAALVSSLLLVLKRSLVPFQQADGLRSCTFNATRGKLLLVDMKNSYLVALARPEAGLDAGAQAIQDAVYKIKHRSVA